MAVSVRTNGALNNITGHDFSVSKTFSIKNNRLVVKLWLEAEQGVPSKNNRQLPGKSYSSRSKLTDAG